MPRKRYPSDMTRKQTRRCINMTPAVYETIRAAALREGVSMSSIIEDMIVRFVPIA
jgi:hypothetical protein